METKPFSMQSPEQIAKDYGGNKQKIAEAMQMGILDPTAGTLAGMFIDRMRSAAQTEQAPQQTVAQQTFAPPAPAAPPPGTPAGLGATPQAAAMPPMNAMPPMGAAPPQAMAAPQGEMPMMAEGGMVPPYMSGGGLSDLPVPDGMFDEPSNGGFGDGYAGGGIVAFAQGEEVEDKNKRRYITTGEPAKVAADGTLVLEPQKAPENLGTQIMQGMQFQQPNDLLARFKENVSGATNLADELAPRSTKRAQQLEELLDEEMSPEALKARRKEDMWLALGQIGAKMATTPGSLLQAAGAGIGEALPGIAAAAKERRGEKRALTKELLSEERLSNKELADRFNTSLDLVVKGIVPLEEAFQDRNFRDRWEKLGRESQERITKINAAAGIQSQKISTSGQIKVGGMDLEARKGAFFTSALDDFTKNAATDPDYLKIVTAKGLNAGQDYLYGKAQEATNRAYGGGGDPLNLRK